MPIRIKGELKHSKCWDCQRSMPIPGFGCCWARYYKPVPGWTAMRNDVPGMMGEKESYCVIDCPLYKQDDDRFVELLKRLEIPEAEYAKRFA